MSESNLKLLEKVKAGELTVQQAQAQKQEPRASGKRKFQPQDTKAMAAQLQKDRELRARANRQSIPFINENVFDEFRLVQGLYLIGAVSGQGKSTVAANILAAYAEHCLKTGLNKKAYLLTNEELSDAALGRVACIRRGKNYLQYHKGTLGNRDLAEVDEEMSSLLDHIYVANDPAYDMGTLEDVQAVLEYARESGDVGLVLLDYYQTVERSRDNPDYESFKVLKQLGSYLKDYGRRVDVPVIAFAQLRSATEHSHFKERVENDKSVYNHAFAAVEIKPDFEMGTTTFVITKDRFGHVQGKEILMGFDRGRFVKIGGDSL